MKGETLELCAECRAGKEATGTKMAPSQARLPGWCPHSLFLPPSPPSSPVVDVYCLVQLLPVVLHVQQILYLQGTHAQPTPILTFFCPGNEVNGSMPPYTSTEL